MTAPADEPAASSDANDAAVYEGLRQQLLTLDPATVGITAAPEDRGVWGVLFELGVPGGSASVVALKDGTTSLYTSGGFGILGGGAHEHVVTATRNLISAVARKLDMFTVNGPVAAPTNGQVVVHALTHAGRLEAAAADADLVEGKHLLSDLFFAGHEVIAHLRSIDETG